MAPKNKKGSDPVPIDPHLIDWAEYWYPISWKGVLAGGIITAVGACATIAFLLLQWRTTSIREEQSELRTATLETQTAQAKAELGTAQADIAKASVAVEEAKARALEAQAQLAKYRARRSLMSGTDGFAGMERFTDQLKEFSGTRWDAATVPYDAESTILLREIQHALVRAGWQNVDWHGDGTRSWVEAKLVGMYGGGGIVVAVSSVDKAPKAVFDAATALGKALQEIGVAGDPGIVQMPDIPNADAVHVLIGKKM
jgi:hypothetical protein